MSDAPTSFWRRPIVWGWIGTALVVLIAVLTGTLPACEAGSTSQDCPSKWAYFLRAAPNEVGDTLAGFAGALAFIWIIVTVAMQSLELKAQREELRLTRQEFEKMAGAQDKQVELLVAQGEIFKDEQRQRGELETSGLLEQRIQNLKLLCQSREATWISWTFARDYQSMMDRFDLLSTPLFPDSSDFHDDESWFVDLSRYLSTLIGSLDESRGMSGEHCNPQKTAVLDEILEELESTLELKDKVGEAMSAKIAGLKLSETLGHLRKVVEEPNLWSEPHWDTYSYA